MKTGLTITGRTQNDNQIICEVIEALELNAEFNGREGYYFLEEEIENIDNLEMLISREFELKNINARFEAQF